MIEENQSLLSNAPLQRTQYTTSIIEIEIAITQCRSIYTAPA